MCYSSNFVTLKSRPSKTTIPQMKFPDFIESMNSSQDGNVSEAPDFTCRRLSIKFFDDASRRIENIKSFAFLRSRLISLIAEVQLLN